MAQKVVDTLRPVAVNVALMFLFSSLAPNDSQFDYHFTAKPFQACIIRENAAENINDSLLKLAERRLKIIDTNSPFMNQVKYSRLMRSLPQRVTGEWCGEVKTFSALVIDLLSGEYSSIDPKRLQLPAKLETPTTSPTFSRDKLFSATNIPRIPQSMWGEEEITNDAVQWIEFNQMTSAEAL